MKLHGYWRSSAAYRVRIALHWKGLAWEDAFVPLREGAHLRPAYARVNPERLVPALETDDGHVLAQSLSILEYLEERHPEPPLLPPPGEALARARVRRLALVVACEVHPLQNLWVRLSLVNDFGLREADAFRFAGAAMRRGFQALEALVAGDPAAGRFCHGDAPSLADVCLVPQLYNARRLGLDLAPYPALVRVEEACLALDAFRRAAPEAQADAEPQARG